MLERRRMFVDQMIQHASPADAYRIAYGAGLADKNELSVRANKLLKIPEIVEAVQRGRQIAAIRAEATGEMAVQRMWDTATADPRELIGLNIGCCRHCWGNEFYYQWTIVEYRKALDEMAMFQRLEPDKQHAMPDIRGGLGFNKTIEPNADCPACNGVGEHYVRPIDTRDLSDQAALLFNGVKQKADGSFEILIADRTKALDQFGRARGVFIDRVRHEGLIGHHVAVTRAVDPHEASQAYQELVKGAVPLALPAPDEDNA